LLHGTLSTNHHSGFARLANGTNGEAFFCPSKSDFLPVCHVIIAQLPGGRFAGSTELFLINQ